MQAAIGYLRVSTKEQGRSGPGLAAQRHDIEAFALREGFAVKAWHQDVPTGTGADTLLLRPGLATALKEAKYGGFGDACTSVGGLAAGIAASSCG